MIAHPYSVIRSTHLDATVLACVALKFFLPLYFCMHSAGYRSHVYLLMIQHKMIYYICNIAVWLKTSKTFGIYSDVILLVQHQPREKDLLTEINVALYSNSIPL